MNPDHGQSHLLQVGFGGAEVRQGVAELLDLSVTQYIRFFGTGSACHDQIAVPLDAGGMGEVYRARDTRLERTLAKIRLCPPPPLR